MKCLYFVLLLVPAFHTKYDGQAKNVSNPCTDQNHFFLAPGVLSAGSSNRACISRFYPHGAANLLLTLHTEDNQTVTASRDLAAGDGGCLDIQVPLLPNTRAALVVNIRYPGLCSWERWLDLRIGSGRVVAVHTERARYRPGETLKARIFALKPDLTPAHATIEEIWLEGPPGAWEGTRIAEWTKVRSKMGLVQIQHEIDEQAPTGQWTIRARLADGSQGSSEFWVGNYELPPFQLIVHHAPRVLRTSERLVWTVCVRYPWSEAVSGMLVVRLRAGPGTSAGVRTAIRLKSSRACHRHAVSAARVGLGENSGPDLVIADFSFQEEGTRIWQNTTVVSQVVDNRVTLQFQTKPRTVLSPGLPYKLKVKAQRWDNKPSPSERIQICRTSADTIPLCVEGITDDTGVARIIFQAEDDASDLYTFQATLSNETSITTGPLTLSTRRSQYQAALGRLRAEPHGVRTFVPLYVSLDNASTPITVHFVVITRGGIIYRWGATTQCPIASSFPHVQIAQRNTNCDSLHQYDDNKNVNSYFLDTKIKDIYQFDQDKGTTNFDKETINNDKGPITFDKNKYYDRIKKKHARNADNLDQLDKNSVQPDSNVSDWLLDRHLLRVMLPIKVTAQMCPDSHLIAYFYYNGEFVSANKHFEMDDCFVNEVTASFSPRQISPGSPATLHITTPGPALCALTAVDTAAKPSPYATHELIVNGLKKLVAAHRNVTEYDAAGRCFMTSEHPPLPSDSITVTASLLASAGVRTFSHMIYTECEAQALTDTHVPRTDFSEAWLWRLVTVNSSGVSSITATAPDSITRFEATAVCLSKAGLGVSQPTVLQVFREFFIHADSPKRLRRGDSAIIRYRIFNYLYEPLSVQIQVFTGSALHGPTTPVESICVGARGAAGRRVIVTARGEGEGSVRLRAKSVVDGNCGANRAAVSDEVEIRIKVDPEGFPVQEQKSILLCGADRVLSSKSGVNWSWSPVKAVAGTETLNVFAVADITGPSLSEADSLIKLPRGCGEQNMARLATNLLSLLVLHPASPAYDTAKTHVARGFTRQLQYIHPSGGFSAFASDSTPSTWLTAFCLRYMRRAHLILYPDKPIPPALKRAEAWLLSQQMENGCFNNEGQIFHRELRGGLNEEGEIASIALTAYVITSLLESTSPIPTQIVQNSLSCLRALPPTKFETYTRIYAHSLLAYALMRVNTYEEEVLSQNEVELKGGLKENESVVKVMELIRMAVKDGDYLWWETNSLSTSIEATGYALLALRQSPALLQQYGAGAVRWLASHRNSNGMFQSTQDTLVALEALTAWASLQPTFTNLTVTVTDEKKSKAKIINLRPNNKIPEVMKMDGRNITIKVKGTGCALIQAARSYNTLTPPQAGFKRLSVQLSIQTDGTFDCDTTGNNCYCAAIVVICVSWSGSFPDMALLEVSLPGGYGVDSTKLYDQMNEKNTMIRRIEVTSSNSRAVLYLTQRSQHTTRGHSCFHVHAVGPNTKTKPAYVKLMDYYNPMVNDTQVYTIPEECPSKITHDTSKDLRDNLYNKGRSLNDEILISHEFTFEDIPEGIPLEDPLYENLKQKSHTYIVDPKTLTKKNLDSVLIADKLDLGPTEKYYMASKIEAASIEDDDSEEDRNQNATANADNDAQKNEVAINYSQSHESKTDSSEGIKLNTESHVINPNLNDFHVIDTDKDLEVPSGIEGPIPAIVLPPPNFAPPSNFASPFSNVASPPSNFAARPSESKFYDDALPSPNLNSRMTNIYSTPSNFNSQSPNFAPPPYNFVPSDAKFDDDALPPPTLNSRMTNIHSNPPNFNSQSPHFAPPPYNFAPSDAKFDGDALPPPNFNSRITNIHSTPPNFNSQSPNFAPPPYNFAPNDAKFDDDALPSPNFNSRMTNIPSTPPNFNSQISNFASRPSSFASIHGKFDEDALPPPNFNSRITNIRSNPSNFNSQSSDFASQPSKFASRPNFASFDAKSDDDTPTNVNSRITNIHSKPPNFNSQSSNFASRPSNSALPPPIIHSRITSIHLTLPNSNTQSSRFASLDAIPPTNFKSKITNIHSTPANFNSQSSNFASSYSSNPVLPPANFNSMISNIVSRIPNSQTSNLVLPSPNYTPASKNIVPSSQNIFPPSEHLVPPSENPIPSSQNLVPPQNIGSLENWQRSNDKGVYNFRMPSYLKKGVWKNTKHTI